jgi:hypothetical protein
MTADRLALAFVLALPFLLAGTGFIAMCIYYEGAQHDV